MNTWIRERASPAQPATRSLAGDVTSGSVTNTASATAGGVTSNTDEETVVYTSLTLVKTADPQTYDAAGDEISYSYLVTNSGSVKLLGPVVVDDDKATDENCPLVNTVGNLDEYLDPGESITCTASYTIMAGDVTSGSVTNTASATAGGVTSNTDEETVVYTSLTLVKTADPQTYDAAGDVISYSYLVTNSGSVKLLGPVVVDDDKATDENCPLVNTVGNLDEYLDPGESITCTASYTILAGDVTSGSVTNTASATAGGVTSNTDEETVVYTSLTLVKTADPQTYDAAGDEISYSYLVTNSGSVKLLGPVVVDDDKATDENCPLVNTVGNLDEYLDPGESITCTASYTILAGDVTSGSVTNTASATAGGVTSNTDEETVVYTSLTLVKTADPQTYDAAG